MVDERKVQPSKTVHTAKPGMVNILITLRCCWLCVFVTVH